MNSWIGLEGKWEDRYEFNILEYTCGGGGRSREIKFRGEVLTGTNGFKHEGKVIFFS
ncbi:hypothetical protein SAMN05660860_03193 [Geoalkalibacter ferrihydriticus]|uniref:Uncharacterized protein n=1 Tax=Geoalkalibacter ferrihydriticus TaxID=392333 RepID=A0A1G9W6V0_9BACT|nr:hypothetical protein SAMN05660860_03193 [Geoalkalibacter ferrihydriticus]